MPKYRLEVAAGSYEADTIFGLVLLVYKHRLWHWRRGEGWTD